MSLKKEKKVLCLKNREVNGVTLTDSARVVYVWLLSTKLDSNARTTPIPYRKIEEGTALCNRTVFTSIQLLKEANMIGIVERSRKGTVYQIL